MYISRTLYTFYFVKQRLDTSTYVVYSITKTKNKNAYAWWIIKKKTAYIHTRLIVQQKWKFSGLCVYFIIEIKRNYVYYVFNMQNSALFN